MLYKFDHEVLNKAMRKQGISIEVLAGSLEEYSDKVSPATVKVWSEGRSEPVSVMLLALSKELDVPYEDFFTGLTEEEAQELVEKRTKSGRVMLKEKNKAMIGHLENEVEKLADKVRKLEKEKETK